MMATRALALLLALAAGVPARAEARPSAPPTTLGAVERARELYMRGTALVQKAQWTDALAAFEESSQLRPHPVTTYNIGACERVLGRYTVAMATLQRALEGEPTSGVQLPPSLRVEAKGYLAELDRLLVRIELTVAPSDAAVAVDGRPLEVATTPSGKVLIAGRRSPGRGEPLPQSKVTLLLDPGTHLLTLSRKGFTDQVVTKTYKPSERASLSLNLEKLPATLRIASDAPEAVVRINKIDVGYAPAVAERPAGIYSIEVEKPGFETYETMVRVNPGEAADVSAKLTPEPLTRKWWFWTGVGVLVTGAVVSTYYATRSEPEPERPPVNGGGLDWAIPLP